MTSPGHVRTVGLTAGQRQTLAARSKRTREKHLRWAAELAVAGWWVVEAGHITISADWLNLNCIRCGSTFGEFDAYRMSDAERLALPAVLAKVNGHVCTPEERP